MAETATSTQPADDAEGLLLHHLRMDPEQVIPFWALCGAVADAMLNHSQQQRVAWKLRAAKRREVSRSLLRLIWRRKVHRRCHPQYRRKAGVAIALAFEEAPRPVINELVGPVPMTTPPPGV